MRTKEEIEAQLKAGAEFIKVHPRSMFGTDNVAGYELFKKIIARYKENNDLDALEKFVEDAYDGEKLNTAFDIVSWLRGDFDEDVYDLNYIQPEQNSEEEK